MKKRFPVIFILTLLSCATYMFAQTTTPAQTAPGDETPEQTLSRSTQNLHQWGTISSFHGLPSERVRAITQTPDGFIWFGTDNGLAKFDGRLVETNISSSFSMSAIRDLEVDSKGALWVASENGAFYSRNGLFFIVEETKDIGINSIKIVDDTVYLTNEQGKVFRCIATQTGFSAELIHQSKLPVQTSVVIGKDIFLGSQNRGLLKLANQKATAVLTKPRPFFINTLERDQAGDLWIGAKSSRGNSGLFVSKELPNLEVVGEDLGSVNSISFDLAGDAWVGTDDRGLHHFNGKSLAKSFSFSNTSGSLRSNQILAVFVDKEGVVWIGTDKGVNRFDPLSPRNERVSSNTQSNFVRFVKSVGNGATLAGTNRGLYLSKKREAVG